MRIFKCKMCGGDLNVAEGQSITECEYCGSKQTVAIGDNEKKINLFNRANRLRINCEFDKAGSIYEQIIAEFPEEAEAYWCLCLCNYGIEYVDDPATAKKIPTCHRASFEKLRKDENYELACEYADMTARLLYQEEAKEIDRIMGDILLISQNEKPYDIFICYKETDYSGNRTEDSVLAQDIYDALTAKGYKVFFSRITLEDKLGQQYEPYIFAALNSAKIMLAVGTDYEHYNAVWVKNEWSRFLKLSAADKTKILIPCFKSMDAYDMPDEFKGLQAQDMGKLGWLQDLTRGIDKLTGKTGAVAQQTAANTSSASVNSLLKRTFMFLEDGKWNEANEYCEKVLDINPECAEAYLGKLMAELKVKNKDNLKDCSMPFDDEDNCIKASRFDPSLAEKFKADNEFIRERNETARKTEIYNNALSEMNSAETEEEFKSAASAFASIKGFKDADEKENESLERANEICNDDVYNWAIFLMNDGYSPGLKKKNTEDAIELFESIIEWKDSKSKIDECKELITEYEKIRIETEKAKSKKKKQISIFFKIAAIAMVILILLYNTVLPAINYKKAVAAADAGNYSEAYRLLNKYPYYYKDTQSEIYNTKLKEATALLDAKKYDEAYSMLESLGQSEAINSSKYDRAVELADNGEYEMAIDLFNQITGYKNVEDQIEKCYIGIYGEEKWNYIKNLKAGDSYTFGAYEQDNNTSNGKEEIEWIVLAKNDNRVLIISKYALDCQEYNTSYTYVTWETSTLRKWMNNDFLNAAFSAEEQKQIQSTKVTADVNPDYSANPGNDTTDKVFLLSIDEVNKYFSSDDDRMCVPTAYAISNDAWPSQSFSKDGKATCWWWLRSPGHSSRYAANVDSRGGVTYNGHIVDYNRDSVRPAMWIEI